MYVKFGSAPSTRLGCRPYLSGNSETCNIAGPGRHLPIDEAGLSWDGGSLNGYTAPSANNPVANFQPASAVSLGAENRYLDRQRWQHRLALVDLRVAAAARPSAQPQPHLRAAAGTYSVQA